MQPQTSKNYTLIGAFAFIPGSGQSAPKLAHIAFKTRTGRLAVKCILGIKLCAPHGVA